jgi:hypothetical protein
VSARCSASSIPSGGSSALLRGGRAFLYIAARFVCFVLYAVLATLEPVVRIVTLLLAVAGFVTCGIYRLLLRDPHFPLGLMLLFSISMCLIAALYGVVARGLARVGG